MKSWKKYLGVLLAHALIAGVPWQAQGATTISGQSSTVFEWFDTAEEKTATPFYQYLQLNMGDMGGSGWDFRGYGRLSDDLSDEVDADSRLYYAYIQKRNALENLDVRLGRQFVVTTAGASIMDGVNFDVRNLGPVDVRFFGGGDAKFNEYYSSDLMIAGGEISSDRLFENFLARFSYVQKWDDGDPTHKLLGLDLDYTFPKLMLFYSETQYSWLTEEVTYFLLGAKYHQNPKWSLRGEYLYSLPVFSSTSIYSVFAVDDYEEVMIEYIYRLGFGLNAFGRYTHEFYESLEDANVYEIGIEKIRTEKISGYLAGIYRLDDDGQDLKGVEAHVGYLFTDFLEIGVGANVDVLERQIGFLGEIYDDSEETTSRRYWVDFTNYFNDKMNFQAKVESITSDIWDQYWRGRLRFNILF